MTRSKAAADEASINDEYTTWFNPRKSFFYYQFTAFDTEVLFIAHISNEASHKMQQKALIHALQLFCEGRQTCQTFQRKLSMFDPHSEIYRIHANAPLPCPISVDTYKILKAGIHYSALSKEHFDISIGALSKLWNWKQKHIPSSSQIITTLKDVNYEQLLLSELDGSYSACLSNAHAQLDVGGIAKGYIADEIYRQFKGQGLQDFLINLGGTIRCAAEKDRSWTCGIAHPEPHKNPLALIEMKDAALVSSGMYERGFSSNEQWYHHILDARTGYPAQCPHIGVSILARSALVAEGVSTTLLMLDYSEALALAHDIPEIVQVFFISKDNELTSLL